jgi:hypothetical protein
VGSEYSLVKSKNNQFLAILLDEFDPLRYIEGTIVYKKVVTRALFIYTVQRVWRSTLVPMKKTNMGSAESVYCITRSDAES